MTKTKKLQKLLFYSIFIIFISCKNNGNGSGNTGKNKTEKADTLVEVLTKPNFNVYIENSASMDGYVNQPSDFKNGLYKLIADVHNFNLADNIRLNFINDTICPQKANAPAPDIIYFIENLKPADFKNSGCEVKNSFLPNIIFKAISTSPKEVNILISDCIFSSQKGNSKDFLSAAKESVRTLIKNEIDKNEMSCVILKMNSRFYGTYYIENKTEKKKTEILNGQNRPYYILMFGNSLAINNLLQKIKFSNYAGFEASYYLLTPNANKPNSKLIRTNKIGDFEIEQPATKLVINDAKVGTKNDKDFQFSIATNLGFLKMDETYLSDIANYEVPTNYKLVSVVKNEDLTNEGLKDYTHIFTIKTQDLKQNQEVFVKLKSKLPSWVEASSTEDDSSPNEPAQQKKTFGVKYLIEGVSSAYADKYEGKEQFSINVKVSCNKFNEQGQSSKIPWFWLILILLLVTVFLIIKNKKS
jgi:hypothetical protein